MKKTVFFLLLSMAFLTTNAQNLNTKDLSKLLEIPYSNIEQGLEKLDELKCKKDTDEKVQRTKLVEKYHPFVSVMKEPKSCKCHDHIMCITSFNYIVISYRSTGLCNIFYTPSKRALDIVSKWEKRI